MRIERRYTTAGQGPYAGLDFRFTRSEIRNPDGSVVFKLENVEVPGSWSQVASDVLAQKYFRKAGVPARLKKVEENDVPSFLWRGTADEAALASLPESERYIGETSSKQVFDRLAGTWTYWAGRAAISTTRPMPRPSMTSCASCSPTRWRAELAAVVQHRPALGLWHRWSVAGPLLRRLQDGKLTKSKSSYEHPQPHACFIQGVEDDLVNDGGIMDLWVREARLFKYGSGTAPTSRSCAARARSSRAAVVRRA